MLNKHLIMNIDSQLKDLNVKIGVNEKVLNRKITSSQKHQSRYKCLVGLEDRVAAVTTPKAQRRSSAILSYNKFLSGDSAKLGKEPQTVEPIRETEEELHGSGRSLKSSDS